MARKSRGEEIEEALTKRLDTYAETRSQDEGDETDTGVKPAGETKKRTTRRSGGKKAAATHARADQDSAPGAADAADESESVTAYIDKEEALARLQEQRTENRVKAKATADALDSLYQDPEETVRMEREAYERAEAKRAAERAAEQAAEQERMVEYLTPLDARDHTVTPVVYAPTESVQHTFKRTRGRIRHKVAAALISILVIFGIGLGAGLYKQHMESEADTAARIAEQERLAAEARAEQERLDAEAEEQRKIEAAREPRILQFIVSAVDLDSLSTRIPLVITGTDAEGNEVETQGFVNYEGNGLRLAPGSYTATIPASPINGSGGLYAVPTEEYTINVPNDDQDTIEIDQAIVLIPLNVAEVTDEAINTAYDWGMRDSEFANVVEENTAAAWTQVTEERERKAAEERAAQLADDRGAIAQKFAEAFFTNVGFPDDEDDSKIMSITNWTSVVGQYLAQGSSAMSKMSAGSGSRYSYATHVSAVSVSGDTVVVEVDMVVGDEIKAGWTRNEVSKTISCTFNADNLIVDFTVG